MIAASVAPAEVDRKPSSWTVASLLVGLPLAYWVSGAVLPWGGRLFGHRDHHAFYGFWLSVVVLHWASVGVCVAVVRRHGIGLSDLGLSDRARATRGIGLLAVVAPLLILTRQLLGPITIFGGTPFFGNGAPAGGAQRLVWVLVAITAGVCEEFVYRGVALTLLRRRGFSPVASVALATIPFALMHGPAGIFGFPFVGTLAVVMSIVYLRTRSLVPGMVAHAILDLCVILT